MQLEVRETICQLLFAIKKWGKKKISNEEKINKYKMKCSHYFDFISHFKLILFSYCGGRKNMLDWLAQMLFML